MEFAKLAFDSLVEKEPMVYGLARGTKICATLCFARLSLLYLRAYAGKAEGHVYI
jgi:hypothetical protein